jgi:alkanesulfonate monooxygenase SsuD/methylene tetrahydromethanopterin reductase-like flavin-dependent oxidoreductase (luciferase family)
VDRAQRIGHAGLSTITGVLLSVLDQSPISEGSTGSQALRNTIDLAQLADRLGYHRYWVSEHHGGPMLAGPSPEALIGPIASASAPGA